MSFILSDIKPKNLYGTCLILKKSAKFQFAVCLILTGSIIYIIRNKLADKDKNNNDTTLTQETDFINLSLEKWKL